MKSLGPQCACGLFVCLQDRCPIIYANDWEILPNDRNFAPYQGSDHETIESMMRLADLQPGEKLCDIGCGDGRVLIYSVKQYGVSEACGYELNKDVYNLAVSHCQATLTAQERSKVKIIHGNGMDLGIEDFCPYDVILLYLLPAGLKLLAPKLLSLQELQSKDIDHGDKEKKQDQSRTCRVVSQGWPIIGLQAVSRAVTNGGSTLYRYDLSIKN